MVTQVLFSLHIKRAVNKRSILIPTWGPDRKETWPGSCQEESKINHQRRNIQGPIGSHKKADFSGKTAWVTANNGSRCYLEVIPLQSPQRHHEIHPQFNYLHLTNQVKSDALGEIKVRQMCQLWLERNNQPCSFIMPCCLTTGKIHLLSTP